MFTYSMTKAMSLSKLILGVTARSARRLLIPTSLIHTVIGSSEQAPLSNRMKSSGGSCLRVFNCVRSPTIDYSLVQKPGDYCFNGTACLLKA